MIKPYWRPRTRSLRALWMLEEIGQPYERVLVDLDTPEGRADYHRINPMEKVPAIADGEATVAESGAILAYLADRFPQAGLAPAIGDPRRGTYLRWLFFAGNCIEPAVGEKGGAVTGGTPAQNGWGSYERVMATLAEAMAPGPWLLGQHFSAADVLVGVDLTFLMRIARAIPEDPAFTPYLDRCAERPALRRALAIDAGAAGEPAR